MPLQSYPDVSTWICVGFFFSIARASLSAGLSTRSYLHFSPPSGIPSLFSLKFFGHVSYSRRIGYTRNSTPPASRGRTGLPLEAEVT